MSSPIERIACGSVTVAVFENPGREGGNPFYSFAVSRSYKDKATDEWKRSDTLNASDLPDAISALTYAATRYRVRVTQPEGN